MNDYRYLAGLVDGDGNIDLEWKSKQKVFRPKLVIFMNVNSDMRKLLTNFGFKHYKTTRQTAEIFIQECSFAVNTIRELLPFLVLKKRRAELVLQAWDIMPKRGGQHVYTKDIVLRLVDIKEEIRSLAIRKKPVINTREKIINSFVWRN